MIAISKYMEWLALMKKKYIKNDWKWWNGYFFIYIPVLLCEQEVIQRPYLIPRFISGIVLLSAGLRRSFRLSRKDRQSSSGEANASDPAEPELLTYEEVTRYQQRPNERPRLVVLIGKTTNYATFITMRSLNPEGNHQFIRIIKSLKA